MLANVVQLRVEKSRASARLSGAKTILQDAFRVMISFGLALFSYMDPAIHVKAGAQPGGDVGK